MTKRNVYHVTYKKNKANWEVRKENNERPSATTEKKQEAIERARQLAQQQHPSKVKIHKKDGTIQTERTYGQDPEKYPG